MGELNERSTLADAQKIEIIALKTQVEALKAQLDVARNQSKGVKNGARISSAPCLTKIGAGQTDG